MLAEAFLCPLLKDCLPTVEHEDDKPGVIRALYNNICSLKKWASTAYNEHVLAPLAKIAMLTKKNDSSGCMACLMILQNQTMSLNMHPPETN